MMGFFDFFGKKEDEFKSMDRKDKKEFLSNDFIDRMVRVEQRVQESFGEHIPYKKTSYYKSLSNGEKNKYEKYLKKKKGFFGKLFLLLFLGVVSFFVFDPQVTGNAIGNRIGSSGMIIVNSFSLIVVFFCLFILTVVFIKNRKDKKHFERYFEVIDNVALDAMVKTR